MFFYAISYAGDNGIVLLLFPLHCTHGMQPLDKKTHGPFKARCKVSFKTIIGILSNPGKPITIYDITKFTSEAFLQSFSPNNIVRSFSSTGLWPMNRLVYKEDDFLGSYSTDRSQECSSGVMPT